MSDSESSGASDTSESTIGTMQFDKVLQALRQASKNVTDDNDYLSFSTLLDIHLSDPTRYSYPERELLLQELLTILKDDETLTYEIGWDIPALIIPYVDSDYKFDKRIRQAPGIYTILKIFECLAWHGNPKELLLQSCELLSKVHILDSTLVDDVEIKERFFDIKMYCIFELIDSCLKRIKTYYPSRFLAMTVGSFVNLLYKNVDTITSDNVFVLKRAYSFARNYSSLPLPEERDESLTNEELDKIKDDEEFLQRKLLTAFITEAIHLNSKNHLQGFSKSIIAHIQNPDIKIENEKLMQLDPLLSRFLELAYSFDIDLNAIFESYLTDSHIIFHSFDYSKSPETLTSEIFEKVIVDYQKNVVSTIVSATGKEIKDSLSGCLELYTYSIASDRAYKSRHLSIMDSIVFSLRSLIPGAVQEQFGSKAIADVAVFWSWYAINLSSSRRLELELAKIPEVLLTLYFQLILSSCINIERPSNYIYTAMTLLTRLLSLSPENIAYKFIVDSLQSCPADSVKPDLIGILKGLLTKNKVDDINSGFATLQMNSSEEKSAKSKKYLSLTEDKIEDLESLIDASIDSTFVKSDDGVPIKIVSTKFSILAGYLNLLIVTKSDFDIYKEKTRYLELMTKAGENVKSVKKYLEANDQTSSYEYNAAGILQIAIDRIGSK